jgi:hypothetical protein
MRRFVDRRDRAFFRGHSRWQNDPHMDYDKINNAIRECVAACIGEVEPMGAAIRCLQDLRRNPGWTDDEVVQVRNGVIEILRQPCAKPPAP